MTVVDSVGVALIKLEIDATHCKLVKHKDGKYRLLFLPPIKPEDGRGRDLRCTIGPPDYNEWIESAASRISLQLVVGINDHIVQTLKVEGAGEFKFGKTCICEEHVRGKQVVAYVGLTCNILGLSPDKRFEASPGIKKVADLTYCGPLPVEEGEGIGGQGGSASDMLDDGASSSDRKRDGDDECRSTVPTGLALRMDADHDGRARSSGPAPSDAGAGGSDGDNGGAPTPGTLSTASEPALRGNPVLDDLIVRFMLR